MWFIGIIAGLFIGALFQSVPVALVLAAMSLASTWFTFRDSFDPN